MALCVDCGEARDTGFDTADQMPARADPRETRLGVQVDGGEQTDAAKYYGRDQRSGRDRQPTADAQRPRGSAQRGRSASALAALAVTAGRMPSSSSLVLQAVGR